MLKRILIAAMLLASTMTTVSAADRVYEMRTYYTLEGRLPNLLARFRDHTTALFEKHGITNIGYWVPTAKPNTLVYLLSYPSVEAAKASWAAFRTDPAWTKAQKASEESGKIVEKVESVYMNPTDFSKLK